MCCHYNIDWIIYLNVCGSLPEFQEAELGLIKLSGTNT
jgi:hypothetical protein